MYFFCNHRLVSINLLNRLWLHTINQKKKNKKSNMIIMLYGTRFIVSFILFALYSMCYVYKKKHNHIISIDIHWTTISIFSVNIVCVCVCISNLGLYSVHTQYIFGFAFFNIFFPPECTLGFGFYFIHSCCFFPVNGLDSFEIFFFSLSCFSFGTSLDNSIYEKKKYSTLCIYIEFDWNIVFENIHRNIVKQKKTIC